MCEGLSSPHLAREKYALAFGKWPCRIHSTQLMPSPSGPEIPSETAPPALPTKGNAGGRLDFLDAIRGLAALAVAAYHFSHQRDYSSQGWISSSIGWAFGHGHAAVFVFFVLSGFVLPWAMDRSGYTLQASGRFLARRWIRLAPPCIVTLLLLHATWYGWFGSGWAEQWSRLWPQFLFVAGQMRSPRYLEVFWTLELEMQFYVFLAIFMPLLHHRRIWLRRTFLGCCCLTPLFLTDGLWLPHYLGFFAMGMALFWLKSGRCTMVEAAAWIAAAVAGSHRDYSWLNLGSGLLAVALIWWAPRCPRPLLWLGTISYSFYLTHMLSHAVVANKWLPVLPTHENLGTLSIHMLAALALATLFYYTVERPSQMLSNRISSRGKR